jgi:death on curing protein
MVITETGGSHGVRERAVIEGLSVSPQQSAFGQELYPSLHDKAAVYAREIIMRHAFVDGNKRTGMTTAFVFLSHNNHESVAKPGEIEKFAVKIVLNHLGISAIAKWLRSKTRKRYGVK